MNNNDFQIWCVKETIAKVMFIAGLPLAILFAIFVRLFGNIPFIIFTVIFAVIGVLGGLWLSFLYEE